MNGLQEINRSRKLSWLLWSLIAGFLVVDAALPPLIDWIDFGGFDKEIQAVIFFAGVLVGQCCFVAVVGGLTRRTWLGGYLLAIAIGGMGYLAVLLGFWFSDALNGGMVVGIAIVPAFVLAATSPLYLLRHYRGWRATTFGKTSAAREPLRLADVFSQIAIVSATLILARVPQVVRENDADEHWVPVVITSLVMFCVSLVVLPLHVHIVLSERSIRSKTISLVVLPIAIVALCFAIMQCFYQRSTSWHDRLQVLPFLLTFLGAAICVFYSSLLLLSACGLRLIRIPKLPPQGKTDAELHTAAHLNRLTWWRIGLAVGVTTATSIYLANLERWRIARDTENAALHARLKITEGTMGVYDRIPKNLSIGPNATNADLAAFTVCHKLEYLYLQDCSITDAGLANLKHFPNLTVLHLRGLPISDDGLAELRHLPKLETLIIEACDVKVSHLRSLPNKHGLNALNLTGTHFGDRESGMLVEFPLLTGLILNHTDVTDASFESISKLQTLTGLELAGTDIHAEEFPVLPQLGRLDLSETRVADTAFSGLSQLPVLYTLLIRNTQITNAALASIAQFPNLHRIDLSDTPIDDEGLRQLQGETTLTQIDLSCTQVTGSGFAKWKPKIRSHFDIILDRTLVNDDGIASLIPFGAIEDLSLVNTSITDACLVHIAQIDIDELDIRGTKITYQGMMNNGMPSVETICVEQGQFTKAQISQLEKQFGIDVEVE